MVDQPGGPLPVDVEGVLLPSDDFSVIEKNSYLRLSGVDTAPLSPAGDHWGDDRVAGGAQIAAALADVWRQLKIERIVASPPAAATATVEPTYQLLTRGGTRIAWGPAPLSKASEEIPAAEKVARLLQYVADKGTLEGRDGPQELDVPHVAAAAQQTLRGGELPGPGSAGQLVQARHSVAPCAARQRNQQHAFADPWANL